MAADSIKAVLAIATAGPRLDTSAIPAATPNAVTSVSAMRPMASDGPRTDSAASAPAATSAELIGLHTRNRRHSTSNHPPTAWGGRALSFIECVSIWFITAMRSARKSIPNVPCRRSGERRWIFSRARQRSEASVPMSSGTAGSFVRSKPPKPSGGHATLSQSFPPHVTCSLAIRPGGSAIAS